MGIFNDKTVAGKLYLRSKIFRGSVRRLTSSFSSGRVTRRGGKTIVARRMGKDGRGGQEGRQGGRLCSRQRRAEKRNEKVFKQHASVSTRAQYGSAASIVGKIRQESKSGALFDLHMGGGESMITGLLSEGIFGSPEPVMILKEIKDPNNWWGGHIWLDIAKRYIYASQAYQVELIWCNTIMRNPRRFVPWPTC